MRWSKTALQYLNVLLVISLSLVLTLGAHLIGRADTPPRTHVCIQLLGGPDTDEGRDVLFLPTGQYIVVGRTNSFHPYHGTDGWILALDEELHIRWQRALGSEQEDELNALAPVNKNTLVAVGSTYNPHSRRHGVWVVAFTPQGEIKWQHTFYSSGSATGKDVLAHGGEIWVWANISPAWHTPQAIWMLRLDPEGRVKHEYTFSTPNGIILHHVSALTNGQVLLTGKTGADGWLALLDENGHVLWSRRYHSGYTQEFLDAHPIADDRFVVVGRIRPSRTENWDAWVLMLDDKGHVLHQWAYGGNDQDEADGVLALRDGSITIMGTSASFSGNGRSDMWMLQLDEHGHVLWSRTYGKAGMQDVQGVTWVHREGWHEGYTLVGGGATTLRADRDLWFVKTDPNGRVGHVCALVSEVRVPSKQLEKTRIRPLWVEQKRAHGIPATPLYRPYPTHARITLPCHTTDALPVPIGRRAATAMPSPTPTPTPCHAQVAGFVFRDANGNHIPDPDESGPAGVEVLLQGMNNGQWRTYHTYTVAPRGYYLFWHVEPGTYQLTLNLHGMRILSPLPIEVNVYPCSRTKQVNVLVEDLPTPTPTFTPTSTPTPNAGLEISKELDTFDEGGPEEYHYLNGPVRGRNDQFCPGDFLTYLIEVNNTGDTPLYNVHVNDQLPPGLSLEYADCYILPSEEMCELNTVDGPGGRIMGTIATLQPEEWVEIYIDAIVDDIEESLTNTAYASADGISPRSASVTIYARPDCEGPGEGPFSTHSSE